MTTRIVHPHMASTGKAIALLRNQVPKHDWVGVPEDLADAVITALRATNIKGRKVTVRRERPRK